jgi:arginyl-tRNA synthetase
VTPEALSTAVLDAVRAVFLSRGLDTALLPGTVTVERPRKAEHGDYATNVALQLAKRAGVSPRDLASSVAEHLATAPAVAKVEVAGPGFLNVTLDSAAAGELARTIVTAGEAYGRGDSLAGRTVNLEFVSANPTGPIHLGHTRWAAVGDALGRVLTAAGAAVTREFYVNDRGVQMDRFGASLEAAALGEETPPDGYHGAYVAELADTIADGQPDILELTPEQRTAAFRDEGYRLMLAKQRSELEGFRTHFDVWFSERTLHSSGAVERALDTLRGQGHVYTADGAIWLRTTDFGDDKDRPLVKSDGALTYFASDCAYYLDKRRRGFEVCVYMLGADHHGYVHRLRAIAACAGDDPDSHVEVLIGQMVKVLRGGEEMKLSKRAGTLITLGEIVELIGVDAARYALARASTDSPMTLDVDVLTKRTNDNPVFYVQYAHARTCNVARNADDVGVDTSAFRPELLDHETEAALLGALGEFPRVVATAAELREPHRVARYLESLAGTYHKWYDSCRVIPVGDGEITDLNRTRRWLNDATRTVIANGLDLLGVSAPERM